MQAHPLARSLALLARMKVAFPECRLSLGLLWDWLLEQVGLQRHWSHRAREIDDSLERSTITFEAVLPTLKRALANDPPAKRHQIMRAAHAILAAAKETHARTEALANELEPQPGSIPSI